MKTRDAIQFGLMFGVGYLLVSFLRKGTDTVSNALADLYLKFTLPGPVVVLGNVQFPNGSIMPIAELNATNAKPPNQPQRIIFKRAGVVYEIKGPRNIAGFYQAVPLL